MTLFSTQGSAPKNTWPRAPSSEQTQERFLLETKVVSDHGCLGSLLRFVQYDGDKERPQAKEEAATAGKVCGTQENIMCSPFSLVCSLETLSTNF
jgi:hypothetical protein